MNSCPKHTAFLEWLNDGFRANYSSLTNDLHQVTNRSELEILQKKLKSQSSL